MTQQAQLREDLRSLILRSLEANYTGQSKVGVVTGNRYQAMRLGNSIVPGFRSERNEFLDQINFAGARVLDLGSNLGEVSRAARARGAVLVDGFEFDGYFLDIANLVNAHEHVTRVSFYQRDITDSSIYREHYDIVLGFSVFTYVSEVLRDISAITDKVFIVETHKLQDNLEDGYIIPITRYFPYFEVLGHSDWSAKLEGEERRAVIAFAKRPIDLRAGLSRSMNRGSRGEAEMGEDVDSGQGVPQQTHVLIDTNRTNLQERFWSTFQFDSTDELFAAIRGMETELTSIERIKDLRMRVYSGWAYWFLYLKGYTQYVSAGTIDRSNIYYRYFIDYYLPGRYDPGLEALMANEDAARERVAARFRDLDCLLQQMTTQGRDVAGVEPVRVMMPTVPGQRPLDIYQVGASKPLVAGAFDGWHRLFAATLCGFPAVPAEAIGEEERRPAVSR